MKTKILISIIAVLSFISSCRYEDGPLISFKRRYERVKGVWQMDKYYLNGSEILSSFKDDTLKYCFIGFFDDGDLSYTETYYKSAELFTGIKIDGVNYHAKSGGSWGFNDNDMNFEVNEPINPYQYGEIINVKGSDVIFKIKRLTSAHFWVSCTNNGNTHEIHFIKRGKDFNRSKI